MTQASDEFDQAADERQALIRDLMPYIQPRAVDAPLFVRCNDERCIVIDSHRENGLVLSVTRLFPYMATRGHYHGYEETLLVLEGSGQLIAGQGREITKAIQVPPGFSNAFASMHSHRVVAGEDGITFLNTFRVTDEDDEVIYL